MESDNKKPKQAARRGPPVIEPLPIHRSPKSLQGQIELPFPVDATESNAPEDVVKVKKPR